MRMCARVSAPVVFVAFALAVAIALAPGLVGCSETQPGGGAADGSVDASVEASIEASAEGSIEASEQAIPGLSFEPVAVTPTYPDLPTAALQVSEVIENANELAEAVDLVAYLAPEDPMHFYRLADAYRDYVATDVERALGEALQMAPLGHNFLYSYNDSGLDEGWLGISAPVTEDFATVSLGMTAAAGTASAIPYVLAKRLLTSEGQPILLADLPLFRQAAEALPVENTEQLFYAVSHGYAPICASGSPAETVLVRCAGILGRILTDGMTETEQYAAIYQYVLLSNHYDYSTLVEARTHQTTNRAFFLEGSVLDGVAVCDGLSKELVVLARLAGLEAYHVGARSGDGAHAYVYVRVDGTWYLSCPTYGSMRYATPSGGWQDYHTMNYLLTDFDTNMAGWPYDSDAYPEVEAALRETVAWDFWSETMVEIDGQTASLHPGTIDEALAVLRDAASLQQQLGMPVEVELSGKVDVLRGAYETLKAEGADVVYLSGGNFGTSRLQVYLFGGAA